MNAIENRLRILHRLLDPIGPLVFRNLRHVEGGDHFRISPSFFFRGQLQFVREGAAVTFEDNERRREHRAFVFQQFHKGIVDRFVGDAVDKKIGPFFGGGARGLELSGMNGDAQLETVTLFHDRMNDRAENSRPFRVALPRRRRRRRTRWC